MTVKRSVTPCQMDDISTSNAKMKVILAGYSKTGTKTMASVFRILGFKTYDFLENYYYAYQGWEKIFKGTATVEDIRETFEGVDALTDTPACHYWEELHEAFPEAKIIFTCRDEDSWYKSMINQIILLNQAKMSWFLSAFAPACYLRDGYQRFMYKYLGDFSRFPIPVISPHVEKIMRAHYRYHNANVLEKAPKDKLLVYKLSDGWGPLCEFLGVPVPDEEFPHRNKGGNIIEEVTRSDAVVAKLFGQAVLGASVVSGCLAYLGYNFFSSAAWTTLTQAFCNII